MKRKINIITTYRDRPTELQLLVELITIDLKKRRNIKVNHFIVDDGGTYEIGDVELPDDLKNYKIHNYRQAKNAGRVGYWMTLNNIMSAAKHEPSDFTIFLPDDEMVCRDFFKVVMDFYDSLPNMSMIQFLIDERITEELGGYPYENIDGTCLIPTPLMESIDWKIPNPHAEDNRSSSGAWKQATEKILKANPHTKIYTPDRSVVFHQCPDSSQMNPQARARKSITAKYFYNETPKGTVVWPLDRYWCKFAKRDGKRYAMVIGGGIGNHIQCAALYLQLIKKFKTVDVVISAAHYTREVDEFYRILTWNFGCVTYNSDEAPGYHGQFVTSWGNELPGVPILMRPDLTQVNEVKRNNMNAVKEHWSSNNWQSHFFFCKEVLPIPWISFRGSSFNDSLHSYDVVLNNGGFNEQIWLKKRYQKWNEVTADLIKAGYSVASVGCEDQYIQGTEDMTGLSLVDTYDLISKAKAFGGNCSGLTHFAAAIGIDAVYALTFTNRNKNIDEEGFHCTVRVINQKVCSHQPGQKDDWSRGAQCESCRDYKCAQYDSKYIIEAFKEILHG